MTSIENPRKPWLAGILTFCTIGLGHIYTGHPQKGLFLFFVGQGALVAVFLPLLYYYPTAQTLLISLLAGFAFFLYCLFDAIKLSRQNRNGYALKKYNKWYVYLGCWLVATFAIQSFVNASIKTLLMEAYKIPAGSLKPTLLIGDQILAKKLLAVRQGADRGDIIIFPFPEKPEKDFIKRVVATGGETIEIVDKKVFINGEAIDEPYTVHSDTHTFSKNINARDNFGPFTVPENAVFVMGDNRDNSYDSRFWGVVENSAIKGKAYTIYWSWDKENNKVRWDRIGKRIE